MPKINMNRDLVLSKCATTESAFIEMELENVLSKEIELTEQEFEFLSQYRNLCLGIPIIVAAYPQINFSTDELSSFDLNIIKPIKQDSL